MKLPKPGHTASCSPGSEPILQSILIGTIILTIIASSSALFDSFRQGSAYRGITPWYLLIPALIFTALYSLSRTAHSYIAAHIITALFFLLGSYTLFTWGFFLPQGLLIYVFVIIVSGIILGQRSAISYTLMIITALFSMAYIQTHGIIPANLYWMHGDGNLNDALIFSFDFAILTAVACYYSTALLKERSQLELRVKERTQQLKQAQDEHLAQLYSFAEFGRLAANLVHDLANPISTISLNLEQISPAERSTLIERAINGVKRIEDSITTVRGHIHEHKTSQNIHIAEVVQEAISIVQENAERHHVIIQVDIKSSLTVYTSQLKFRQLIVNLLSNAIDACSQVKVSQRIISIQAKQKNQETILQVRDHGIGIKPEHLDKVFSSFFTTKDPEHGTGIGLTLCKEYVEQDLGGEIHVTSAPRRGSCFMVKFPSHHEPSV